MTHHKHNNPQSLGNYFDSFSCDLNREKKQQNKTGKNRISEQSGARREGKTHTAGQGSFWQLVWLSSGRVKGSHRCSSTIPVVLSTQWTICLWTPGTEEKAQGKLETLSDLGPCGRTTAKLRRLCLKHKKKDIWSNTHWGVSDVGASDMKAYNSTVWKYLFPEAEGGFGLLCGTLQSSFCPSWGDLSPRQRKRHLSPLRALCSACWGP